MNPIIKALRKALDASPENWETRHALIEAYLGEGDTASAHELLSDIEALPDDEASLISAALCYASAGAADDARNIVQHVLGANPASAEAHLALATIAHRGGDGKTALRHFLTASSLDSAATSPELEAAYGHVLESMGVRAEAPAEAPVKAPEPAAVVEPKPEPVAEAAEAEPEPVAVVIPEEEPEEEEPAVQISTEPPQAAPATPAAKAEPAPAPVLVSRRKKPEESAPEPVAAAPVAEPETPEPISKPVKLRPPGEKAEAAAEAVAEPKPKSDAAVAVAALAVDSEAEESVSAVPKPSAVADDHDFLHGEYEPDHLADEIQHRREEVEASLERTKARDKLVSLSVTLLIHAGAFLLLGLVYIAVPRIAPPQIVAAVAPSDSEEQVQNQTVQKAQRAATAASQTANIVAAASLSTVAMSNLEFTGMASTPGFDVDFAPSMSFGATGVAGSKMMFGQKMEGEVLGVILDVSGSMAEYLPLVVREVDKNFKDAPIVYVNHAGILGATKGTEIYPILADEVRPNWPKEWNKGTRSPYWFLWGDLPRKAEQHYVDRLIDTFKTRTNMFIARGGENRLGAAAEFLIKEKIDSLYIFSDFEDFVDVEVCESLGKKLGLSKVRTYVQPAAARTEHLAVVSTKIARRSRGNEMPPLTDLIRPDGSAPEPIGVVVKKEMPVPEGVKFATPRQERPVDNNLGYNYERWYDDNRQTRFKDELKVVEYPNFDIVVRGPECRAYIYMKSKEGFIQSPIIFGYHSYNPYLDESDGKWYYPRRKWLRNTEEPKFEDNEFTWKMVLEDEIKFEVVFWFKEDELTGTYTAELPPNGENDSAFIYFTVPPMVRERGDIYYSPDFPGGLSLDDLRVAMAHNTATFYLPVQEQDRLGTVWSRLGFKKGENHCPYNVIYRNLPDGVREVTVGGKSFGDRRLQARTTSNNLLLQTGIYRADMELFEGFQARLIRPKDRRTRVVKTEAITFSIE